MYLTVQEVFLLLEAGGFVKASDVTPPQLNDAGLRDVMEQLKRTPVGIDNVLGRVVPQGVAFHHAGNRRFVIDQMFFILYVSYF